MDRRLDNIGRAILSGAAAFVFTLITIVLGHSQSVTIPLELGAIIGLLLYLCIRERPS
jgi:hypothetical protein